MTALSLSDGHVAGAADERAIGAVAGFWHRRVVRRAERLLKGTSPNRAISLLGKVAEAGSAEAQFRLGECYLAGTGTARNPREAGIWLLAAARQEHARAQFALASLHLHGFLADMPATTTPEREQAAYWLRRAAEAGLAEAQALLGHLVGTGRVEARFESEAASLLGHSVAQNCPQGHLGYALHLLDAKHDAPDLQRIRHHAEQAAASGLPSALHLLGSLILASPGERATVADGVALIRRAAAAGLPEARRRLGLLLACQPSCEREREEGLYWLRLCALQGDREASRGLANLLLAGDPAKRAVADASRWLRHAMNLGDLDAASDMARLVASGQADGSDAGFVRAWFKRAAEAGDARAAYNFAVCLANGIGGSPDGRAALPWLARAAPTVPEASLWYRRIQDATG